MKTVVLKRLTGWCMLILFSLGPCVLATVCPPPLVPANLVFPEFLKATLEELWMKSPTFRQQCSRISEARQLRIHLTFRVDAYQRVPYRALTRITRDADGWTTASTLLLFPGNPVELLGHEFEHIVEYIEGFWTGAESDQNAAIVARLTEAGYETERAIRAGHQVLSEFQRFSSARARTSESCVSR